MIRRMIVERFVCCEKTTPFEKVENGYKCTQCGKIYLNKSICYLKENLEFDDTKYQSKFRGRKADYIKNENKHLFSTLQTGKVEVMRIDKEYNVLERKIVKVKKNVLEHKLNMNDTFLTITDKGVINVYDIKRAEIISEIKLGIEYSHYKIKIFPFGKQGNWLYIDTEKIVIFSNDFKNSRVVLVFKEFIESDKAMSISSVDYNLEYDCFAIHILYWKKEVDDNYIKRASFHLNNNEGTYTYEKIFYDSGIELTYDFDEQIYYGIYNNTMIMMKRNGEVNILYELPIVKSYSDGGIFWVEEFLSSPHKMFFLSNNLVVLLYAHEWIIMDIENKIIKRAFDAKSNLIQSFFILDENTITYSAGLNTYIVKISDNDMR